MLEVKEIVAISICTPVWTHEEMVVAAAKAGKHVLCEKPMARNLREAQAMVDAAEKAGTILMIGFMKRFNPGFLKIKEIISKGLIGRVYHTDIHWNLYFPPGSHPSKIFSEDERVGGGVILDNCSHYIDLFRWLQSSDVQSVYAETSTVLPDRIHEDQATLLMRFANGATSILDMGFNRVEWVERSGWDSGGAYDCHFTESGFIYGTEGTIMFEAPPFDSVEAVRIKLYLLKGHACELGGWHEVEVPVTRQPGGPMSPRRVVSYPFEAEVSHFVDCALNGTRPSITGQDGLHVVKVSAAAYKSADIGSRTEI
jgi:predicted dehydrogenase